MSCYFPILDAKFDWSSICWHFFNLHFDHESELLTSFLNEFILISFQHSNFRFEWYYAQSLINYCRSPHYSEKSIMYLLAKTICFPPWLLNFSLHASLTKLIYAWSCHHQRSRCNLAPPQWCLPPWVYRTCAWHVSSISCPAQVFPSGHLPWSSAASAKSQCTLCHWFTGALCLGSCLWCCSSFFYSTLALSYAQRLLPSK